MADSRTPLGILRSLTPSLTQLPPGQHSPLNAYQSFLVKARSPHRKQSYSVLTIPDQRSTTRSSRPAVVFCFVLTAPSTPALRNAISVLVRS